MHQRQGYATAMLAALLKWAAEEPGVRVVRAAISPDNAGSLATIAGFGFSPGRWAVGRDRRRELLFEVPAGSTPACRGYG